MRIKINKKSSGFTITELVLVVVIIAIFILILTPFINSIRSKIKMVTCKENLQNIGLGIKLYAKEHQGNFPSNLEELVEGGYAEDVRIADYHYTTGYTILSPSDNVIVFDKDSKHRSGKHVLYISGDIVWERK